MAEIEFRDAIRDALDEELARDERVIFFGEDVAVAGGVFAATPGLYEKYGAERVFDTPISELAMTGAAYGAAVTGHAAGARDHVRGLPRALDGQPDQPGDEVLVPDRRAAELPARDPLRRRRRRALRRDPFADAGLVADRHPRPEDRRALDARRCEGPAQGARSATTTRWSSSSTSGSTPLKRPGGRRRAASRSARRRVVREGSDVTLVSAMKGVHDCLDGRRPARRSRASRPR